MVIEGIVNINKPEGMSSHDVVSRLRRRTGVKRIGHTGTLDPMATGVLPVCIGKATRLVEYFDADYKTYEVEMKLGITSDTLDITGEVCEVGEVDASVYERLSESLEKFKGRIMQTPPKYSAIRVDGKRLYEYAREGKEVEIASRPIYVKDIEVLKVDRTDSLISLSVECSKGTYIRTICDDLGRELGCGACMTKLVRVKSGCFAIEDSVTLDELFEMSDEELLSKVCGMDTVLGLYAVVELSEDRRKAFGNGMSTSRPKYKIVEESKLFSDCRYDDDERIRELANLYAVKSNGDFLGIAKIDEDGELQPLKVIECK